MKRLFAVCLIVDFICFALAASAQVGGNGRKGVNYEVGNGMDQLNCDGGNVSQIAADMREIRGLKVGWVRVETSMTEQSGQLKPPVCPALAEFQGLKNMLSEIKATGAQPLINILGYHYDSSMRAGYIAWLNRLLDAAPEAWEFEVGNEENLSKSTEGWKGAPAGDYPDGWEFHASDFAGNDAIGKCPNDPAKFRDVDQAVASYVSWLADTYNTIKRKRPNSTVVLGGLSSWQAQCWTQELGKHQAWRYADAIGFHPYGATPAQSVATFNYFLPVMKSWPKKLPVWVTEFGFTTSAKSPNAMPTEEKKAQALGAEYRMLEAKVGEPILYYTARDYPLTTKQWQDQCASEGCVQDKKHTSAGYISGTNWDVSGAGLFEWLNGKLVVEPSYGALAGVH